MIKIQKTAWSLLNNLVVTLLSVFVMYSEKATPNKDSFFISLVVRVASPMQEMIFDTRQAIDRLMNHYVLLVGVSQENEALKKELLELKHAEFQLLEVTTENERLKSLLQFGKSVEYEKILAQVIGWDASHPFKVFRVNKGRKDGVLPYDPVITMTGLVGYISRVFDHSSEVLTILDSNNKVDVLIDEHRTHGILEGHRFNNCRVKYVFRTQSVKEGATVITAGLGQIYPKGIKIGTVSEVDKEKYGITQELEVKPSVDFRRLEEVLIIKKPKSDILLKNIKTLENLKKD